MTQRHHEPSDLRWHRLLVHGETPGTGEFFQTLWVASESEASARRQAERSLGDHGDILLHVESCTFVDQPVPSRPEVSRAGRAYFEGSDGDGGCLEGAP